MALGVTFQVQTPTGRVSGAAARAAVALVVLPALCRGVVALAEGEAVALAAAAVTYEAAPAALLAVEADVMPAAGLLWLAEAGAEALAQVVLPPCGFCTKE